MPKPARSYWKATCAFPSCRSVLRFTTPSSPNPRFLPPNSQALRPSYQLVVQGLGQIDSSDIVKGYEVDTDTYVTLEPSEIDALKLESKKTIDLVQIIDPKEIDYRYFEHPYFVTPAGELAGEGYVVIAMHCAKPARWDLLK
jgi:DNA end-binding protein Ku